MTDIELVRLNIQDQTEPYTFHDEIIIDLLAKFGNDVNMVSAQLWLARAGNAALRNFKFSVDGRSVDKTMTAKECREQAAIFKEMAMLCPGDEIAEITWTDAFDLPEEV